MVRVPELFVINKDLKMFKSRLAWLDKRIAERETSGELNASGAGFDRAERAALKRLLSQIEERGITLDPFKPGDEGPMTAGERAAWAKA